jgi:hypothetical protein
MVSVFPANHIHATPGDRVRALTHAAHIAGITPVVLGSSEAKRPLWERLG